jgi:hypothetical protein
MMPDRLSRTQPFRILACASQGSGSNDDARLHALLQAFDAEFIDFRYGRKAAAFINCLRRISSGDADLFVLEGSGMAAGVAAILGRLLFRRPYVVSSGDAVAPYLNARYPLGTPAFNAYERLLYRCCAGFIGWTPYLVGRALTFGAPRGVTIAGWAPYASDAQELLVRRAQIRRDLGIPADAVVFGLAGSLRWSDRVQFCYGAELVRAARRAARSPYVLIVGDGTGLPHLKELAGDALGRTILLPGRIPRDAVPHYLAAMDVGSLPQSVDGIGNFRYTTKVSEYRDVALPFVTNEIPMAYDLDRGDIWRLPGENPWSEPFIAALATLMSELTLEEAAARKVPSASPEFDEPEQIRRVTAFLRELLEQLAAT